MSGKAFVDTNILLYAHDRSHGVKHKRARTLIEQLWESGKGVLSTQVLQELCVNLSKKTGKPSNSKEIQSLIDDYSTWEVVVNGLPAITKALEAEDRYRISFWDALILQAAEESDAEILYSEDLSAGQRYGAVLVMNPLTGD